MPVIVKLIPRRRNTWIELVPDGGDSIRLPLDKMPAAMAVGASLASQEWARLVETAEYCAVLDRALRLLARREHFAAELRRKLLRRTYDRELVQRVLDECARRGYLDDERAAVLAVEQLLARGGLGRARINQELKRRGCRAELARQVIADHAGALDETAEVQLLLSARRRHFVGRAQRLRAKLAANREGGRTSEYELKRQLGAAVLSYLAGRGFQGELASRAARQLANELLSEPPE